MFDVCDDKRKTAQRHYFMYIMAAFTTFVLDGPGKPVSLYQLALDKVASWQSAVSSVLIGKNSFEITQ